MTEVAVGEDWQAAGRVTIEGDTWAGVFSRDDAALLLYAKLGDQKLQAMRVVPFGANGVAAGTLDLCNVEAAKGTVVTAPFAAGDQKMSVDFRVHEDGTVQAIPGDGVAGLTVSSDMAYGVVPGAPLEDVIHRLPCKGRLCLPSENIFVGLLKGERAQLHAVWPAGDQRVALVRDGEDSALEIHLDGKPVFLRTVAAQGIWHEEDLSEADLGEDLAIKWKRPFNARWKTQLDEGDLDTNFPFQSSRVRTWRPNFGFYQYPVWFQGDQTMVHLSKKISCENSALIYALEGHSSTPLDFARQHVEGVPILEKRRSLQRYPSDSAGLQNCDGRAWTKWAFRANIQAREQDLLREAFKDFLYSIKGDSKRLDEYPPFIGGLRRKVAEWRDAAKGNTKLRAYLKRLDEGIEPLGVEFQEKMNRRTPANQLAHEIQCLDRLSELVGDPSPDTYAEACYLLDELQLWSLIEAIPARVGGLMRVLHANAAYWCADCPEAVKHAEEIRRDIREFLIHDETNEIIY